MEHSSHCYPAGYHFVFPETDEPAHVYNRLLDAPLVDLQDAIEKFVIRWPKFKQIRSPNPDRDLAVFLHDDSGEIVVLRQDVTNHRVC